MQQRTITLRQQTLDAEYEMQALDKKLDIAREKFRMGIKSKAELDVAEEEYRYKRRKTELQMQSLRHDSTANRLRHDLIKSDVDRANKKRSRTLARTSGLVITAPVDGQLSYLAATLGQQISSGSAIGEIKVLTNYKLHVALNENYIDRITTGQPATIAYEGKDYALHVSKVVPEVKDRSFEVDLTPALPTREGVRKLPTDEKPIVETNLSSPSPCGEGRGGVLAGTVWPSNVRIGKSYRVKIELGKAETAIVIPRGDFYGITGGQWIYKVSADGSKAVRVPVTIGRQNPKQYEVTSGLKPGDKVIVSGYEKFGEVEQIQIK